MPEIFLARQPIFDKNIRTQGYEILYRDCKDAESARFEDVDGVVSQVFLNILTDIGLERLVGGKKIFINMNRRFLLEDFDIPIPQKKVVFEILEDVKPDIMIIEALKQLRKKGFKFALDDVVNPIEMKEFLPLVDIVKFDLLQIDLDKLEEYSLFARRNGCKLLGEKVETMEIFEICRGLGFDYFQGFFLSKPRVVTGHRVPGSRISILRALAKIHSSGIDFHELEKTIQQDVSLSYMLLRLVNSVYYGTKMKVESIMGALTLLGIREIRAWLSFLVISKIDDKPDELVNIALIRAKMCELLTEVIDKELKSSGFIAGLFSALDAMLEMPLEEILKELPLSDVVKEALLSRKGPIGQILDCVLSYERGEWEEAMEITIAPEKISDSYIEALDWTNKIASVVR